MEPLQGPMITLTSLKEDLRNLGVHKGMTLIVHSSLSKLGWVCGGAEVVCRALMEIVTDQGTILMPTQTPGNSDPAHWVSPPVSEDWWESIREHMPPYDPAYTPTMGMGVVPELFRTLPGVLRSEHPMWSLAAWGEDAAEILAHHTIDIGFGPNSPLDRLLEKKGHILHLGSALETTTFWHRAEYECNVPTTTYACAMIEEDTRVWKSFSHIEVDAEPFIAMGEKWKEEPDCINGYIGKGKCYLFPVESAHKFAVSYLQSLSPLSNRIW
ncbi:aminoglycoside N(3)-acetyltransferase [Thermoactinomyces sp. DSM 45892]|uniref:aminoglycoside N(3)-acetyltransferase n=1 Tax=Thermoactinomyces sp. DSM 45892 TaxID=1882753 RepID=UPI00089D4EDB|nr:AAC(3) family N-acetyltransferase [Thermoactinomyces sp. DSM 45892]SDY66144.1 aminoglycoside 3-N-acetyltransferase [Thermoactinomyces sp. DSM 45892]